MTIMADSQIVWIRDSTEGYIKGKILENGPAKSEVVPIDRKYPKRMCLVDEIFPSCDGPQDHDDNCELMFLNEATLLNNLKNRYFKDKVYTYVANILIALNPYKEIKDLYSDATIKRYRGKSLGELPPHVFAIAEKAIRDMRIMKISQTIIVSGESGAGKTENTKYLLKYLCNSLEAADPIETKILNGNPILEAFGNSKTTRNNNSSRFGKFIEVHFDSNYRVVGGYISHYLLEKSRICNQSLEERNYHIFYMLCAGAPRNIKEKLCLSKPDDYRYLAGCTQYFATASTDRKISQSSKSKSHLANGPIKDPILDDYDNFHHLDEAFSRLDMSEITKFDIYALVAGILHLGIISFAENPEDNHGGCQVSKSSEHTLSITSRLFGVDSFKLRQALVSRVIKSKGGGIKGTDIMVPLKIYEANNARDALAKALYSRLFERIIAIINRSIPFGASTYYIGVLDIAGFEYFLFNSFEQFCINYCNEKLQKFFNDNILKYEQELYRREGLNVPEVQFSDNQDIIELIESKPNGIFTLLDEEIKLPKPSFDHFTLEVHQAWNGHSRLSLPRTSQLKAHRTLRNEEGFLVRHFAGAVCYNTNQFVEKNNDALHASLEALVRESANPLINLLFSGLNSNASSKEKLVFISVGSKFKTQLQELMERLKQNGTNFIRCIRPNSQMADRKFEGSLALMQLNCSGTTSVLELMEYGYPSRVSFDELYNMYKQFLPPDLLKLEPKVFCEAILHSLHLNRKDFKFGTTRVFFRPGKFVEFDQIMKSYPENLKSIVDNVKKWLVRSRWIKSAFCAICVIKLKNRINYRNRCASCIQKIVRGFLARKRHQPRFRGILKIKSLLQKLTPSKDAINQVQSGQNVILNNSADIKKVIKHYVKIIQNDVCINSKTIAEMYDEISNKIDSMLTDSTEHKAKVTEQMQSKCTFNKNDSMSQLSKSKKLPVKKAVKRLIKQKTTREILPSHKNRYDMKAHFPGVDSQRVRCKLEKCTLTSVFYCKKCKVHLCVKKNNNCYFNFHNLVEDTEE